MDGQVIIPIDDFMRMRNKLELFEQTIKIATGDNESSVVFISKSGLTKLFPNYSRVMKFGTLAWEK